MSRIRCLNLLLAISFVGIFCSYPVLGQNLALGRPGDQDSYHSAINPNSNCFDGNYGATIVCHTLRRTNPWIRSDLDAVYHI